MNRKLMIGLAVVAGLSLYVSLQSDDELLAPGKAGARAGPSATKVVRAGGKGAAAVVPMVPWVSAALVDGIRQWQARINPGERQATFDANRQPWSSARPPAPPPPPVLAQQDAPPPPPMAPRFPHAWVGRFNDEPIALAAGAASDPAKAGIARAVLTGPQSTWVVRAGDVIEGQWRVDRIQDRTMSLTYLPLQQQQTIAMR